MPVPTLFRNVPFPAGTVTSWHRRRPSITFNIEKGFVVSQFLSMKLALVNPVQYDFGMDLDDYMVQPEDNGGQFVNQVDQFSNICSFQPHIH
ncbi:hypothetical protein QJS10_CPB15g01187 [Acorus calamus]|uniref:Uncharacterized protein n=1 Tax=Acorus calamus TaxID=4465 RepID=A0AAV9D879_ACOCL|nr:hypothetical protein QJS10_CPB15g01187 [Acorus calamus]